jgi:hypothetical protein
VSDYPLPEFDESGARPGARRLPGGLSMQALAGILLVAALMAILFMFFGPSPDAPTGLATATAPATVLSVATGASVSGTPAAAGVIYTPAAGAAAPVAATTLAGAATAIVGQPGATDSSLDSASDSGMTSASTPAAPLGAGSYAKVGNTDTYGLRLRFGPGLTFATIRIVPDGEILRISGDKEVEEGYTWYRLEDDLGNVGWGAEEFLSPVAAPSVWSPPLASPTFEASSEG